MRSPQAPKTPNMLAERLAAAQYQLQQQTASKTEVQLKCEVLQNQLTQMQAVMLENRRLRESQADLQQQVIQLADAKRSELCAQRELDETKLQTRQLLGIIKSREAEISQHQEANAKLAEQSRRFLQAVDQANAAAAKQREENLQLAENTQTLIGQLNRKEDEKNQLQELLSGKESALKKCSEEIKKLQMQLEAEKQLSASRLLEAGSARNSLEQSRAEAEQLQKASDGLIAQLADQEQFIVSLNNIIEEKE